MRNVTHLDWLVLGKIGYGGEAVLQEVKSHFPNLYHASDVTEAQLVWAYQNAAALVLPSLEEGFGLPVLEASQFGTPLILSRIPAFKDIVAAGLDSLHRDTALFFDSENGLQEILHHLKGNAADWRLPNSRPIAGFYSWERTASEFVQIYDQLGFSPSSLSLS
jgi:glycosyltransferase involved in cell wall biosynthesis